MFLNCIKTKASTQKSRPKIPVILNMGYNIKPPILETAKLNE